MSAPPAVLFLAMLAEAPARPAEGPPLSVADLGAYRAALSATRARTPADVGFRELWRAPKAYKGHAVRVAGTVRRRFGQGAFGTFPPLVELWIVSDRGDPYCIVYPKSEGSDGTRAGESVRFSGTFLRFIRYPAADGPRLAPLIVGPAPPAARRADANAAAVPRQGFSALDWTIGGAAAAFVTLALVRQHLRRPQSRHVRPSADPDPWFEEAQKVRIPDSPESSAAADSPGEADHP